MKAYTDDREISVLIVEDHNKVRAAVRAILEAADGIHVVGEAGTGAQAVTLTEQQHPDVLVLDLDLEVVSGEIEVSVLMHQFPGTRVLVLTSFDDPEYCLGFVENGAAGCMLKEDVPGSLVQAVQAVQNGPGPWISPRLEHLSG